jgi:hypothetical protein
MAMGFIQHIRKLLGVQPGDPLPSSHQREEQSDEILIFVSTKATPKSMNT